MGVEVIRMLGVAWPPEPLPQGFEPSGADLVVWLIGLAAMVALGALVIWLGERSRPPATPKVREEPEIRKAA